MSDTTDTETLAATGSLASLLESKRHKLRATLTKVTNRDGTVVVYDHGTVVSDGGETDVSGDCSGNGFGFVVDMKPDLSVGEVTPWFLISSQDVPADAALLKELKVTHVLSLLPGFRLPKMEQPVKHFCVELYDEECSLLDNTTVRSALDFITEGKTSGGRILIHCNAGISRAPSVAMFYFMRVEGMSFDTAWQVVKSGRPTAKPNAGFWNQLKNIQEG